MTREEAIETIRRCCPKVGDSQCYFESALRELIPELAESEDERIRKELIEFIQWSVDRRFMREDFHQAKRPSEWIAWLEKQKESLHISETCKENADSFTDEDERIRKELVAFFIETRNREGNEGYWHDLKVADILAHLEKQKENIEKEYVFRPLAGTDIASAALQAIRRADEGDRLVLAFNGVYIPVRKGCNANKIVDIYEAFIEKQKEQKPKLDEVGKLEFCKKCSRSIFQYQRGYDQGLINGQIKAEKEQKPAEWSNEDERKLQECIKIVEGWEGDYDIAYAPYSSMLKSLHPQKLNASKLENFDPVDVLNRIKKEWPMAWDKVVSKQEWSKEDEDMFVSVLHFLNTNRINERGKVITWVESLPKRFSLQPKQEWSEEEKERTRQNGRLDVCYNPEKYGLCHKIEWSEEDEEMIQDIIDLLDSNIAASAFHEIESWLKSLPQRFNLQPKQEWNEDNIKELTEFEAAMLHIGMSFFGSSAGLNSNNTNEVKKQAKLLLELVPKKEWSEEDQLNLNWVIAILNGKPCDLNIQVESLIAWLKSLRPPQYCENCKLKHSVENWKPSEEQIEALLWCTAHLGGADHRVLAELYEHFRKLREE